MWYPYTDASPIVFVTLHGPEVSLPLLPALVDSGADAALFDVALAEHVFGLKRSLADRGASNGIGQDPIPTWIWPEAIFSVEFAGIVIPLVNLEFMELGGPHLLGREDFFRRFWVAFDQPGQRMYLSSDPAEPWPPRE